MAVVKSVFGKNAEGQEIYLYTLTNEKGMKAVLTNLGAILVKLIVPDKDGKEGDVVLGFDTVAEYYVNTEFFGSVVGPSANRIAGATFEIDGEKYTLDVNDNDNNLHSHRELGYHKQIWDAEEVENGVKFTLEDADGNLGFPGNKKLEVTYTLDDENALKLEYHGTSDKKALLNPTNHTYFNVDGHDSGSIETHELQLIASNYTPVVEGAIPTGEIATVKGTPMDFTEPKEIGKEINADFEQLNLTGGYDHNWVIDGWDETLRLFAVVKGPKSGRVMKAYTTLPGVQFYAGNYLYGLKGKDGVVYEKRNALCLETQYYPDTVHQPNFPSCIFGEGREYKSVTVYQFV